jgi:nucleoside-diphosphate-sugar epimerase
VPVQCGRGNASKPMHSPRTARSPASTTDRLTRRAAATLVTGAGGEVGHALLGALHAAGRGDLVALDLRDLEGRQRALCREVVVGDIRERSLLERIESSYEVTAIYHLAAVLSARTEAEPELGHEINVGGTLNMLRLAAKAGRAQGRPLPFIFPSSLAVYGLRGAAAKTAGGAVAEDAFNHPATMYGCNKLYCEHLGRYYSDHFDRAEGRAAAVDFRSLRFPGLISAETLPTGGSSDYAAEMVHAAAAGRPYTCFVRPDTRMPFMTMPDAIEALLALAAADAARLTRRVYNVRAFNPSAQELAELVKKSFPGARITFEPDPRRQAIVDSWPADLDDRAARGDWGFAPRHDLRRAFQEYLVPAIRAAASRS